VSVLAKKPTNGKLQTTTTQRKLLVKNKKKILKVVLVL
jgi:hypothetical protein